MRFTITTLGCKVNQYDGSAIAQALTSAGMSPADDGCQSELVVVNTCCVTTTAMSKSRRAIRRAVRAAGEPVVLVTGCYSDYDGRRIAELLAELSVPTDRTFIVGHHGDLAGAIAGAVNSARTCCIARTSSTGNYSGTNAFPATIRLRRAKAAKSAAAPGGDLPPIDHFHEHQRAFVKVQDGCDAFCTYCIVPFTRPRLRWRTVRAVREECRKLVQAGHKEIVLVGVFLGAYGRKSALRKFWPADPQVKLTDLLESVADIPGIWRVRLSSLEPADVSDQLLAVFCRHPAVARHLHLPLQSGSEKILRRMNRQYTPAEFKGTVDRIRHVLDTPAITTDIIVGFPGETDADFRDTLALAQHAGFAKIHAFPFSPIEGTAAWAWRSECPPAAVVRQRLARLAQVEMHLAKAYRSQFIGKTMQGLIESPRPASNGQRLAMTDRYQTVFFTPPNVPPEELTGKVASFNIDGVGRDGLLGRLANA